MSDRGVGPVVCTINGLRYRRTSNGNLIDQYGRVFSVGKDGKPDQPLGVGWTSH